MDYAAEKKQFSERGFTVIRGFCAPEETRALESAIVRATPRSPSILDKPGLIFREYLHHDSEAIRSFICREKTVSLLKQFIGGDFWIRKDQSVRKQPGGVEFPWHQDNGYNGIFTPYLQFWVALSDMTPENGALSVVPGSHRKGLLPHVMKGAHFVWDGDGAGEHIHAKPGDVVLFSSFLLHRTGPNQTDRDRHAYIFELMPCSDWDPFAKAPFFIVARQGRPAGLFVKHYEGEQNLQNRLRYAWPLLLRGISIWRGDLRRSLTKRSI